MLYMYMNIADMSNKKISRESPVPLYIQLKELIKGQIAEGVLKPGASLPSERKLCKLYGVSHITVRQALIELTKEGLLFRSPGRGTFVKPERFIRRHESIVLGVVIPELRENLSPHFTSEMLLGVKSLVESYRFTLVLYTENEIDYLVESSTSKLDGLILTNPMIKDTRLSMLKRKQTPFVVIGRGNEDEVYTVDNDNEAIGYLLSVHFLKAGHNRIGFINGPSHLTVSEDRLKGYKKALKQYGIKIEEDLIMSGDFSEDNGYEKAKKLVDKKVSAIICADDFIALGVLRFLKEKGIKIPNEISIAGCNNSSFTRHTNPPLTTVEIFPCELGRKAGEKLLKLIKGENVELRSIVDHKLIIRESSFKKQRIERG